MDDRGDGHDEPGGDEGGENEAHVGLGLAEERGDESEGGTCTKRWGRMSDVVDKRVEAGPVDGAVLFGLTRTNAKSEYDGQEKREEMEEEEKKGRKGQRSDLRMGEVSGESRRVPPALDDHVTRAVAISSRERPKVPRSLRRALARKTTIKCKRQRCVPPKRLMYLRQSVPPPSAVSLRCQHAGTRRRCDSMNQPFYSQESARERRRTPWQTR